MNRPEWAIERRETVTRRHWAGERTPYTAERWKQIVLAWSEEQAKDALQQMKIPRRSEKDYRISRRGPAEGGAANEPIPGNERQASGGV